MDNRQQILETALHLFHKRGYDAVGVQEIAEKSGVTKPTLYHYFGSKYGLLEKLIEDKSKDFMEDLEESRFWEGRIEAKLWKLTKRYMDFAGREPEFCSLLFALFYAAKENEAYQAVQPMVTRQYERLVQMFEDSAAELGNMNGRQKQFAVTFFGMLNHFLTMRYEESGRKEILVTDQEIYLLIHQFLHGIYS